MITVENKEEAANQVCDIMKEQLEAGKLDVLGLATGSTMIPIYEKWVESDLSFEHVTSFNLDEYVGLSADNKNSYAYFMNQHLFNKKKFKQNFLLNGVVCVIWNKNVPIMKSYFVNIQWISSF